MNKTSDSDLIREYARKQYLEPARQRGESTVTIVVGDIVRPLRLTGRVPNVCQSLRSKIFLETNGLKIVGQEGPPSGLGTRVAITYALGNAAEEQEVESRFASLLRLRGIAKEVFASLGGGEAFIRNERSQLHGVSAGNSDESKRES
jgi:hypothetical protein